MKRLLWNAICSLLILGWATIIFVTTILGLFDAHPMHLLVTAGIWFVLTIIAVAISDDGGTR